MRARADARGRSPFEDEARRYAELEPARCVHREPRPYQAEALDGLAARSAGAAWSCCRPARARPTSPCLAIDDKRRSTLVVAPTLDLVRQWYDVLRATFGVPGRRHRRRRVRRRSRSRSPPTTRPTCTWSTSATRFGLVVFDECHHLPGADLRAGGARCALAPFRLGLTATPERADGREAELDELIGPIVYRKDIVELVRRLPRRVRDRARRPSSSSPDERARVRRRARASTATSSRRNGIRMVEPDGLDRVHHPLVAQRRGPARDAAPTAGSASSRSRAPAKLDYVEHLLAPPPRTTARSSSPQDNATAYAVSRRFLVPAITHQTKVRERSEILAGLRRRRATARW